MLFEQYRFGPADVVVVSADGLMAVPSSVHTPSALTPAAESIGANLWLAFRHCVTGGVRCGVAAGGIILIWRGLL